MPFKFLKAKQENPEEVGKALILQTLWGRDTDYILDFYVEGEEPLDLEKLKHEIRLLWAFAVDYAVTTTFGPRTPTRDGVMGAFYGGLDTLFVQGDPNGLPLEEMEKRTDVYVDAVNNPAPQGGVPVSVGMAFAKLCGKPNDAQYITKAVFQFGAIAAELPKTLRKLKF